MEGTVYCTGACWRYSVYSVHICIVHGTFSYSFYQCGGYSTYTGACWLLTVHTSFSFYQCGGYTVYSIPVLEHAGGTVHDMREGGHYKSPPAEKGQSHEKKNTRNGEKHL